MLKLILATTIATAPVAAIAADCTAANAIYTQPETKWELHFSPVPPHSAANMTGAFSIAVPGTDKVLIGEVYQPNGYSSSLGIIGLDCPEDETADQTECKFWDGTIYGNSADGIIVFPGSEEEPAPDQVLFPQFAASVWYSTLREHFIEEAMPLDVFTYSRCASGA